jgi:hypothetical protein
MKKILGVNKNVFYLSLVSLFNDFSNEMIYSVMPAFYYGFCQLFGGVWGGLIWSKFGFGFSFRRYFNFYFLYNISIKP